MQPEVNERKKMMASATSLEKFDMQQRFGYQPSFVRNMLQIDACKQLEQLRRQMTACTIIRGGNMTSKGSELMQLIDAREILITPGVYDGFPRRAYYVKRSRRALYCADRGWRGASEARLNDLMGLPFLDELEKKYAVGRELWHIWRRPNY